MYRDMYSWYFECLSLLSPDLSDFIFVRFETFLDVSRICQGENSTKSKNKIDGGTTSWKRRNTPVIMSFRRKVICQWKHCRVLLEDYMYCSVEHGTMIEHYNRSHISWQRTVRFRRLINTVYHTKKILSGRGFEPLPSDEDQNSHMISLLGSKATCLESGALDHSAILTCEFESKKVNLKDQICFGGLVLIKLQIYFLRIHNVCTKWAEIYANVAKYRGCKQRESMHLGKAG